MSILNNAKSTGMPEKSRVLCLPGLLHSIIVVEELDVAGSQSVASDKVFVSRRPLVLVVARQHALDAHAHAGDALDGAPALLAEQVEADDAVGVDVGMHGDRAIGLLVEGDLGRFWTASLSALVGASNIGG